METESWKRNLGNGILETESWKRNLTYRIIETESRSWNEIFGWPSLSREEESWKWEGMKGRIRAWIPRPNTKIWDHPTPPHPPFPPTGNTQIWPPKTTASCFLWSWDEHDFAKQFRFLFRKKKDETFCSGHSFR